MKRLSNYCTMGFYNKLLLLCYLRFSVLAIDLIENAQIIGYPQITCSPKWITVWIETSVLFQGRIFVEGHPFDSRCSSTYITNLENNATFRFPIVPCATYFTNQTDSLYATANVRVTFHPYFITNNSRIIKVDCEEPSELNNTSPRNNEENTICHHLVMRKKSSLKTYLTIGETIYHRWTCSPKYDISNYAILLRNCDVNSPMKETVHLVDENGCAIDEYLFDELSYSNHSLSITAVSRAFKFVDQNELRFSCHVVLIKRKHKHEQLRFPKCSISKNDLQSKDPSDSLYLDFLTIFNDTTKIIEARTLTEWITVMDNPKILESLEETGMKVMAKVNDSINEDAIQQDKLLKQDSITEFYPNSIVKYKGHIPTIDEMLARMHNKVNIGRKAIPLDQELLPLQLSNESSIEIPLTSINSTNSIFEQNSPVEDDLLNLSGLPNAEYFEAEEESLESFESIMNKTKNMDDASRLFKEDSYEAEPNVVVNNSVENLKTKATSTTTTKQIPLTTASPLTTQTITETNFFSTKLFKSIFDGFADDNKVIQSEEIDIHSFNTVKPHDHQNNLITDSESNVNRAMSDCNNKAPLGSEEPSEHHFCAWQQVNLLLFLFTLCSLIIWLVIIGVKIHRYFWQNTEVSRARRRVQTTWFPNEDFDSFTGWYSRVGTPKPPRYDQG